MPEKIWLSSPHMGGREREYANEAFDTNWIAPLGPHVNNFEKDLQDYNQVGHAAALSSGTAAIHLSLILNDVGPGDLVFVQSFTFSATVNPILYQGAIPVLIDSEPGSWNMCPKHLERAIKAAKEVKIHPRLSGTPTSTSSAQAASGIHPRPTGTPASGGEREPQSTNHETSTTNYNPQIHPDSFGATNSQFTPILSGKPKAILPVHLYGMPANLDAILEIGRKYNLPVIEDAAESLGSTYKSKATGTYGQMGVYSFNGNKIITTSGGGALVSDEEEKITHARKLATQARDAAPHYQHSEVGYNYRLSNVLAGIGRGQMEVLDERVKQRRANFQRYQEYFQQWNQRGFHIEFQEEQEGSYSNRWLTAILVDPAKNKGLTREKIRLALDAANIEARPLWKPMHLQPVFEDYPFFGDGASEHLFNIGLCLPSGSNLTHADYQRIFNELDTIFESV